MNDLPRATTNLVDARLRDDLVLPFHLVESGLNGRLVRLGPALDTILTRHDYPEPVSHALGDALALTALFATALKFDSRHADGRFILQTKTDGPLGFLVVHFDRPGQMRGYASVKAERRGEIPATGRGTQPAIIGHGHLAMTVDPGGSLDSYQGIVPLSGDTLLAAVHTYFRQSEQLPTFIRLAVARHYAAGKWTWRAGGLMLQYIPKAGGGVRADLDGEAHDATLAGEGDEDWQRVRLLAATVEDHELLDPTIAPERLVYRLFHEEGIRVLPDVPLAARCRCSEDRIRLFLDRFGKDELADMREADGRIRVTCEFCSRDYRFNPDEIG
jgi:molecular chaperone Hsp33